MTREVMIIINVSSAAIVRNTVTSVELKNFRLLPVNLDSALIN